MQINYPTMYIIIPVLVIFITVDLIFLKYILKNGYQ